MMLVKCSILVGVLTLVNSVTGKSNISKCLFYDKRNYDLKQTFYVPTSDVEINYARSILKNVEFKCEGIEDYESKVKCNLCVYTEIVNNKHIRQGQIIQIFMNECMYGFYYYDNISQYTQNNKAVSAFAEEDGNSQAKLDDIYFSITKDVAEGNTSQINFFKQPASKYHPVCYVTE
ncbi:hypothetical protein PCYB_032510 [Plasmodium cynomolgi strain B]|uniref:CYIR protein n=1 Tax=Plasmodium cynomolgi (strain B) TaxID=1120755 RepID=K6UQ00_PLACD|nr:hypothetical protein PCYB_032510 [Plasmodium cynomolgi strain B]GAB64839.1 hypothetical protein PCYB_032510 [Plasmodium cynomolgi strain B]